MLAPLCSPGHNQKAVRHRAAVIGRCCVPKLAPCTSRANFVSGIGCMDLRLVPSVLRGRFIQLEPYHEDLKEEVRAALNCDPEGWELLSISGQGGNFEAWWSSITAHVATGHWLAYEVRDLDSGTVVGTSSLIGRASGRGRGCQCVAIAVVAGALK